MSIQFPTGPKISDRRYHEAGIRGRFEVNLRVVRGTIDTTTPSIIEGVGFSVGKNSTGDVTITFDPKFDKVPSVTALAECPVASPDRLVSILGSPDGATVRLRRADAAPAPEDGKIHFTATGPI